MDGAHAQPGSLAPKGELYQDPLHPLLWPHPCPPLNPSVVQPQLCAIGSGWWGGLSHGAVLVALVLPHTLTPALRPPRSRCSSPEHRREAWSHRSLQHCTEAPAGSVRDVSCFGYPQNPSPGSRPPGVVSVYRDPNLAKQLSSRKPERIPEHVFNALMFAGWLSATSSPSPNFTFSSKKGLMFSKAFI